ncbi:hypothetical protein ACP6L2_13930 [Sphingobacterium lactis]|uniref:hypothetical protein n=1 Tax=Sphingobacterium lactis TaxID=797291 RepID=UPI003F813D52
MQNSNSFSKAIFNSVSYTFAVLFILIFGLFVFIHYYQEGWKYGYETSATAAFIYLFLGLFLWISLLLTFAKKSLLNLLRHKRHLSQVTQRGKRLRGEIKSCSIIQEIKNTEMLSIDVEFNNLVGSTVQKNFQFLDTKPEEKRYKVGKAIALMVDEDVENPLITLEEARTNWDYKYIRNATLTLFLLIIAPSALLIVGHVIESQGQGWRYLSFFHPFILVAILAWLLFLLLQFISLATRPKQLSEKLLLYGKTAVAKIVPRQTINFDIAQPSIVQVTVAFEHKGKTVQAELKKFSNMSSMQNLVAGKEVNIIYDQQDLTKIELYGN